MHVQHKCKSAPPKLQMLLLVALSLLFATVACLTQVPTPPIWPDQFTANFVVKVEYYNPDWSANGVIYYDWKAKVSKKLITITKSSIQTFRTDFIDWCMPLFDSRPTNDNNYTCSVLATQGNTYFVNHTASHWQDNQCCSYQEVSTLTLSKININKCNFLLY